MRQKFVLDFFIGTVSHQNFATSRKRDICPYLGNTGLEECAAGAPINGEHAATRSNCDLSSIVIELAHMVSK